MRSVDCAGARFSPFCSGRQALSVRTKLANPRPLGTTPTMLGTSPTTLGVLRPLLAVEGQGAHPRASGVRKQVWVCSADAGVCHALKANPVLHTSASCE